MAQRQKHPSCSHLPATPAWSKHRAQNSLQTVPMEQTKTGSAKTAQELHRAHHCQLWELLCSKHAAAKKQLKSQQSQEAEDKTEDVTLPLYKP